jgi:hypothetical protein
MSPSKKVLSPPVSRAKADKRNEREKSKRATKAGASGGTKSAKKRKPTTDVDARIKRWIKFVSAAAPEFESNTQICIDLLLDRVNNLESKELALAKEGASFYERADDLRVEK